LLDIPEKVAYIKNNQATDHGVIFLFDRITGYTGFTG